jgi:hypothetical protein
MDDANMNEKRRNDQTPPPTGDEDDYCLSGARSRFSMMEDTGDPKKASIFS